MRVHEAPQHIRRELVPTWSLIGVSVLLLAVSGCRNRLPAPEVVEARRTEAGVGVVAGKVVRGGVGASGVAVWLQPRYRRTTFGSAERIETAMRLLGRILGRQELQTDAAGSFRIADVPTGQYDLAIRWGAYEFHQPGLRVAAGEVTAAHVSLGTGRIALQVVDTRNRPVPGVSLQASPLAEGGTLLLVHDLTDRSGRASIELAHAGRWHVDAKLGAGVDGRVRDVRVVEGATTQAVLRLAPFGVVSIRVVDAARRPVAGRSMRMEQLGGGFLYAHPTDAQGLLAVPATAGPWRIEVQGMSEERQLMVVEGRRTDLEIVAGADLRQGTARNVPAPR